MKRSKLWFGIGLVAAGGASGTGLADRIVVGSGVIPAANAAPLALASPQADGRQLVYVSGGEGGDGGESGEGGEAAAEPAGEPAPIEVFRAIGLVRGHLIVGGELVDQGLWDDALPQFLRPIEEIYPIIRGQLGRLGVSPFEASLKALLQTVKAKNAAAYEAQVALTFQQVDAADAQMIARSADPAALSLLSALGILAVAAGEYKNAVAKDGSGTITLPVEYQDSRGFVLQAEWLIEAYATAYEAKDKKAFAELRASFAELMQAWPMAIPPAKAAKDPAEVAALVSRIELRAGKLM